MVDSSSSSKSVTGTHSLKGKDTSVVGIAATSWCKLPQAGRLLGRA